MKRSETARPICEICPVIDARVWQREGRLRPGEIFPYSWTRDGEPAGGISVRIGRDEAILSFRISQEGAEWVPVEQHVPIVWTACHFGGRRPWFGCTAVVDGVHCQRKAAKLYLASSPSFACRRCHDLVFASQLETGRFRGLGRARKIRMRLGAAPDLFGPFPARPRRMHRTTYHRLRQIHDAALARV
jgi:hypothetical protein